VWTDCEGGSLTIQSAFLLNNEEMSGNTGELMENEGVWACSCCTRRVPQKDENDE